MTQPDPAQLDHCTGQARPCQLGHDTERIPRGGSVPKGGGTKSDFKECNNNTIDTMTHNW
jgi:hypothetical protein